MSRAVCVATLTGSGALAACAGCGSARLADGFAALEPSIPFLAGALGAGTEGAE